MKTRHLVKAVNLATNETYMYPASYRYGTDPRHMHAPPFFTDETAFATYGMLKDAPVGGEVFIEWYRDRFYALDLETQQHVAGPTVWRRSRVLEHLRVPASDA